MELVFDWTKEYEINIAEVDRQHRYLVNIINSVVGKISDKTLDKEELSKVFTELLDYTKYHFETEEKLMKEKQIANVFFEDHVKNHRLFVDQVVQLHSEASIKTNTDGMFNVVEFLISWLGFHILVQDKNMGRQLELIEKGIEPDKAYEMIIQSENSQTSTLVKALNGLINVVIKRNAELLEIKKNLEQKVSERTKGLVQTNKTLKMLALTDTLTTLPNRRHLFEIMQTMLDEAKNSGIAISALMIDLDNFKEINDNYGHEIGDKVLKEFSKALKSGIRASDFPARLGGDEFFVLLPNTDLVGAKTLAENLINIIRKIDIQVGDKPNEKWQSAASIGIATVFPSEFVDVNDFIKRADMAVYKAKNAGKNCVRVYD